MRVEISRAGNQVTLAYSSLSALLTDQVGSFSLAYLQQNATTVAATAASVAYVQISMSVSEGSLLFPARLRVDLKNPQ
jgi:hypothetical protein